jgi:diketogulonate reductase-like aldo/keto reductase
VTEIRELLRAWLAGAGLRQGRRNQGAEPYKALEQLLADGKVRTIGDSNFMPAA